MIKDDEELTKKYDKILLDIDNTITDLQVTLDVMAEELGVEPKSVEDAHSFRFADIYGIDKKTEVDFWERNEALLAEKSKLVTERTFKMLENHTHEDTIIFVVTMRPESVYDVTFNWLRENGVHFDHLACIGMDSKIEYAQHFGIRAIFEDNDALFNEVTEKGLDDEFDLYVVDYPYNEHITNATRIDRDTGLIMK